MKHQYFAVLLFICNITVLGKVNGYVVLLPLAACKEAAVSHSYIITNVPGKLRGFCVSQLGLAHRSGQLNGPKTVYLG